jgi:pimeloyl-ACP methyl ester carboxylesterase
MNKKIKGLSVFLTGNNESKAIIFVHGFPFDHNMWDLQVSILSKDYYCVTYDVRGLGESVVDDGQYTMELFVDDLETIVDELSLEKPILCSLSMGGYISLRAMERFQNKFSALIVCDTKSVADDNESKLKRAAAIKQINSGKYEDFVETFVRNCFGDKFAKENNSDYRSVVDRSKKFNPLGVKGCLLAMAGRTETTNSLSNIIIPTLVICGEEDKISPVDLMKTMANKIPNSSFVVVKDAGHMAPIENPEKTNSAIMEFLNQNNL